METNLAIDRALALILERAVTLPTERVPLRAARGRVLREPAVADADSPRFDCSAVDGYALRRADAERALEVVGEIQAGTSEELAIGEGKCARIFTGARIPAGADCVAMQEDVERAGDVVRLQSVGDESHIRSRGENCRAGEVVVPAPTELHSADLAALASCGVTQPVVTRRPRVVHLATGDELIDPAQTPTGTQLRDSNSTLVATFLEGEGAALVHAERLPDSLPASQAIIDSLGHDFDLLLVSGGASVGTYDFARPMLEHGGFAIEFQNINLRPGKPLAMFARDRALAFALPGNPVSHWVILQLFIAPLLAAMKGLAVADRRLTGRLSTDALQKPNRRVTYLPAVAQVKAGEFHLEPRRFVSSGDIGSVARANALLEIPAESAGFPAGSLVSFLLCT